MTAATCQRTAPALGARRDGSSPPQETALRRAIRLPRGRSGWSERRQASRAEQARDMLATTSLGSAPQSFCSVQAIARRADAIPTLHGTRRGIGEVQAPAQLQLDAHA